MFDIQICPVKMLYLLAQDGDMDNVAALAVSSYDIDQTRLQSFCQTLCLRFDDITNAADGFAFSPAHAQQIARFIKALPEDLDTLFVCCDSGQSRSSAMAAAISRYCAGDELRIWKNPRYSPNPLVYSTLCAALGQPVTPEQVDALVQLNKTAFSHKVNHP